MAARQTLRGTVELVHVADVDSPTAFATRSGDAALYVAEQDGRVVAVDEGGDVSTVLDLTSRIESGGEQGLLGLVFSPLGDHLYVHFTNRGGDTRVEEYAFGDDGVDVSSRRRILAVRQPQPNHNGGQLVFGPDGMLYVGLGDGGGGGDRGSGHAAEGNGQSLRTLLGKILRIDPTPTADTPYTIPADNPFVEDDGRPEIWSYGLRNPWRFSFDRETGDLWIADVGQDEWEEIDFSPAAQGAGQGTNFGWNVFEAEARYRDGDTTGRALLPLVSLSHDRRQLLRDRRVRLPRGRHPRARRRLPLRRLLQRPHPLRAPEWQRGRPGGVARGALERHRLVRRGRRWRALRALPVRRAVPDRRGLSRAGCGADIPLSDA